MDETAEEIEIPRRETMMQLEKTATELSHQIIEMTTRAGSGHPSSALSAIDLMTILYFGGVLRYDAQRPQWANRDRFILSKGHAAPALYAVLAEAGYFSAELLKSLRQIGASLEGHPNMRRLAGVEASTGSLGQGLSIGVGHALAARLDGRDYRVYVLIGDGEMEEGQIWEAALAAAKYRLNRLTVLLDYNKFQQTGAVTEVMPSLTPLLSKWSALGWHVSEIDGHDLKAIKEAYNELPRVEHQPQIIIAHTLKGRGLSPFMANQTNRKHGQPLNAQEKERAFAELQMGV